jgi:hypothetical protein
MFDFTRTEFFKLAIHQLGNKSRGEGYEASASEHPLHEDLLQEVLFKYFFSAFKGDEQWRFSHPADLRMNDMYTYCQNMFAQPEAFLEISGHMLHHLYEASNHPKIKPGELFVALFHDVLIDDELVDAIGIFKAENKHTFLQVGQEYKRLLVQPREGIDTRKLDKGVLIFNTLADEGYLVKTIDALAGQSDDAQYWNTDFLGLAPIENAVYTTRAYLHLYKDFVEETVAADTEKGKLAALGAVNRAVEYFEQNEDFRLGNFAETVFEQPEMQAKFIDYTERKATERKKPLEEVFEISNIAVKQEKKRLKHLITLDDAIQIKLNPALSDHNNAAIERGYDPDRKQYYYKIYYRQEN